MKNVMALIFSFLILALLACSGSQHKAIQKDDIKRRVVVVNNPGFVLPRPAVKLANKYPGLAKELEAEAVVIVSLVVLPNGKVDSVSVDSVKLNKSFPPDVRDKLHKAFAKESTSILLGAQFTPPVIMGKNIPVRMNFPLRFKLR